MTTRSIWAGAALVAAIALTVSGCAAGGVSDSGTTDQSGPIKLGATATITGPYAGSCTKQVAGAQGWIDAVNAEGGVNGRQIEWTVLDDAGDPQRGVSNVRKLIGEGAVALFDNCGSAGTVASLQLVDREGIPNLFVNSASDAILHPLHESTYTLTPLFDQQLAAEIPALMEANGPGSAALVYLDGFSPNILPAVELAVTDAGGELVADIGVTGDTTNWGPTVLQLKEANPDYVFIAGTTPGSGQLVAEMANQGFTPAKGVAGTYGMADDIYLQFAGDAAVGNTTIAPVIPPGDPKAAECNATLAGDETPSFYSVMGCASAKAMVAALVAAGDTIDYESILGALPELDSSDVPELASLTYSDSHLMVDSLFLWTVGADGFELAQPDPVSVPDSSAWITE
jgi:branched-chain amino acid transport system substrate-binding protein